MIRRKLLISLSLGLSLILATPALALAQDRTNVVKPKADAEIERRVNSLNQVIAKIQGLKRLSDSDKSNLVTMAQNEITNLNSLKTDRQAILTEYRVYMLFMPQLRIYVAADRIDDTVNLMTQILTKLQSRATTNAQKTALTDAQNKLTDAKVQADNAIAAIKNLAPDNGNNGTESSNKQALMSAKNILMTAMSDIQAARKDFATVRSSFKPVATQLP